MPTVTSHRRQLALIAMIMLVMPASHDDLYGLDDPHPVCSAVSHRDSVTDLAETSADHVDASDTPRPCDCGSANCCGDACGQMADRLWAISTRAITSDVRCADLEQPRLQFFQVTHLGRVARSSFDQYLEAIGQARPVVVYVHGNRMNAHDAIRRGIEVYRSTRRHCGGTPIDWVIWSWPSEKEGILVRDARRKYERTDAQGLYLGWLLREHVACSSSTTLIGYSFGGRVVTGALHALGGGQLGGRVMPGEPIVGIPFRCGLVAPALNRCALTTRGIHSIATKNLDQMVLLYNRRDAVLKRFWLVDRVRGTMALGYSGPTAFAPRFDGSQLPVFSRDCASTVGIHHVELDYYDAPCRAGREMANLINGELPAR